MKNDLPLAVIAILRFKNKIFYIERQQYLKAFPGYFSFPGGKVDAKDSDMPSMPFDNEEYQPGLLNALVREVEEETNIDLSKVANLTIKRLGIAESPPFNPHRFNTHFFVVDLKESLDIIADTGEAASFGWSNPEDLLYEFESGSLLAVPPTIKAIKALQKNNWDGSEIKLGLGCNWDTEVPMIEPISGIKQYLPLSNTFPPANRTNCFVLGDSPRIVIDPSPRDEAEYVKLLSGLVRERLDAIFLTHHHPDHHEFSPLLARELGLPVLISERSLFWLKKDFGENYFEGSKIRILKDGDIITSWKGEDVLAYEQPGHADGQLGLAPKSLKWFIVSDLIQSIGTVLVGGKAADMQKYYDSLQRVIDLNPKVVLPSHGIALGGTHKLQKTLAHRKMREAHIKELQTKGHSLEEIYEIIYFDLVPELKPYALATIRCHLERLRLSFS